MTVAAPGQSVVAHSLEFRTTDPAEIERLLGRVLGGPAQVSGQPGPREVVHTHRRAGAVALDTVTSDDLTVSAQPQDSWVFLFPLSGVVRRETDGVRDDFEPGDSGLAANVDQTLRAQWCGDSPSLRTLALDRNFVARVAATSSGRAVRDLRFTGYRPLSPHAERRWTDSVGMVARCLFGTPEDEVPALVVDESCRLLAAMALATFPNTAIGADQGDDDHRPAGTVARARAFIDDHARQNISIDDIAEAACVTPRAVQLAFRRELGATPTAYLRRVRLSGVRDALRNAAGTSRTVTEIAAEWGFAGSSRFTQWYRDAFGELPSESLRTAAADWPGATRVPAGDSGDR